MKKSIRLALVALGLSLASSLSAQDQPSGPGPNPGPGPGPGPGQGQGPGLPQEPADSFHKHLFQPERIMACQAELKLTEEQSKAIKEILSSNRAAVTGLEWDMNQAMAALGEALSSPQVDEAAALQLLDKVLDMERSVKRSHLQMAIQLKNKLTPEQQEILTRQPQAMRRQPWPQMPQRGQRGPGGPGNPGGAPGGFGPGGPGGPGGQGGPGGFGPGGPGGQGGPGGFGPGGPGGQGGPGGFGPGGDQPQPQPQPNGPGGEPPAPPQQ